MPDGLHGEKTLLLINNFFSANKQFVYQDPSKDLLDSIERRFWKTDRQIPKALVTTDYCSVSSAVFRNCDDLKFC